MKINFFKNVNYLGWVIIFLTFAFLYFSYFFIYIPRQENRLQQRAFRILKEYGNNMFDKNNYYKNHFQNYKLYYSIRYFTKTNEIKQNKDSLKTDPEQFKEIENVVNRLDKNVNCQKSKGEDKDTAFVFSKQENKLFLNYSAQLKQNIDTTIENSIREIGKYYQLNVMDTSLAKTNSAKKFLKFFETNRLQYKLPIDKLMEGLKFDRLFENIILFDSNRVYYNSKLELVTDITRPNALCDSVENHQGGIWESMNIRGKDKQVMILPIDFVGKRFYIAGIISDNEYKTKTRTIDNQFIILIGVLLLLVLIGMPVLKIIFIGKNERLKSTDASASLISSIFGTGLLILMSLGIIKHKFVDHPNTEDRIIQISDKLYNNVTSNIDSIKNLYQAVSFNNELQKSVDSVVLKNNSRLKGKIPCHYLFSEYKNKIPYLAWLQELSYWTSYLEMQKNRPLAQFALKKFMESGKKFHLYNDSLLGNMFPINEIILINKEGIISKAVTSTPFSELVPVDLSQRNYFINARDTVHSWPTRNHFRFYIESIKSYNTGDGETAISFHNSNCKEIPVTAITSALPSLYRQVLPKDVEFVIINTSGKVLYHSIKSKNLHENFLDECDFDERLEKAINFRTEGIFHIDYNEKEWMLRIIPIKDTPLFHITLIDESQNNDKNARIFLFTFYFLIVILIVIGLGLLILRWIKPKKPIKKRKWFLDWILYKPQKYSSYLNLSFFLFTLIIVQFVGFSAKNKPVAVLLYHIIFITYSSFVSLLILNRKSFTLGQLFKKELLPENFILFIVLFLVIIFLSLFSTGITPVLSTIILVLLTLSLPSFLGNNDSERISEKVSDESKRRSYLLFLFLWLTSLAVLPVFQSYRSIKSQEDQIERQQQFFTVAQKNLLLYDSYYKFRNVSWFKQIQGDGLDHLKVEFLDQKINKLPSVNNQRKREKNPDVLYALLPDPVTKNFDKSIFVNDSNYTNREWIKNNALIYSRNGSSGIVSVSPDPDFHKHTHWNFVFLFMAVVIIILLWVVLKYIASGILNLQLENPNIKKPDWLETLFMKSSSKQILLQTYYPEFFLNKSLKFIGENKVYNKYDIILIKAEMLAEKEYKIPSKYLGKTSILWIRELDQLIYEIDKHELFLTRLLDITRSSSGKIIIEIPFSFDFIDEVYNDFSIEKEREMKIEIPLKSLRKDWTLTFRNFTKFNGFYQFEKEGKNKDKNHIASDESDLQYSFIWSNLTSHEKIFLFDLADDGLVNIKNKFIINRLIRKNLITLIPTPTFISDDFQEYILKNLSSSTVKALEGKLGLKGKWKNTRYLILFILIPLAAFIMISQGVSVEKIFGIFAGILTVVTGTVRLFDSQIFKHSSS